MRIQAVSTHGMLVALLTLVAPGVSADSSAPLFDDTRVHDIALTIDPATWATLKRDYLLDTYYPAAVTLEGQEFSRVGIRSRGNGSRNPEKPNLMIAFDKYEKRSLLGISALVLKANNQDASLLRELLSMKVLRTMGVPAPREALARLFVNGEYLGVYTLVERINADFLERQFSEKKGALYEWQTSHNPPVYRFEYLGSDPALYCPSMWSPVNNEEDPGAEAIAEFVNFINNAPDNEFRSRISEYLDTNAFIAFIAAENFLADYDGFLGTVFGMNNFYFYRFDGRKRSIFIPWDKDGSFDWDEKPILEGTKENVLARRVLEMPGGREQYLAALSYAAALAGGSGGWLQQELDRLYKIVRDAALADTHKQCSLSGVITPCSAAEFEKGVEYLRRFLDRRAAFVASEVRAVSDCKL